MFATTQGGGTNLGQPDVCYVSHRLGSPTPVACTNTATPAAAIGAADGVLFGGAPAHHLGTTIPISNTSHPAAAAGVSSNTMMGPSRNATGAASVLCDGHPAARLGSRTVGNALNCSGATVAPSQLKVVILAR